MEGLEMPLETVPWDVTEHLDSEEAIAAYLDAVFEDGDPKLIAAAIGDVARARGMTEIAEKTGLSRESFQEKASIGRSAGTEIPKWPQSSE